MQQKRIRMRHPNVHVPADVPESAVRIHQERGWQVEAPPGPKTTRKQQQKEES